MRYAYTAKDKEGVTYTREEEAKDKLALYAKVRGEGSTILKVTEKGGRRTSLNLSWDRVNTRDKIIFAKNLSSMLSAGLSLPRALGVMEREARKDSMRKLLGSLSTAVSHGDPLSESMRREAGVFPPLFASMVKAGEDSGDMSGALKVVAMEMEKSYLLTRRIRGAMIYPSIILCLMITISILLLIYMVPTLTATFKGLNIELPLSTRIIIASSDFLVTHTLLVLSTFAFLVLMVGTTVRSAAGKRMMDAVSLKLPLLGPLIREVGSARTTRTLSSLLSAGVTVDNALEVASTVQQNHLYRDALAAARLSVEKGEQLSAVFNKYPKLYPPFVAEMAAVGEETGKLSEMLGNVALTYEEDVDERTKDLSAVIEPLLMSVVGVAVAIFAISMLAPTYSLVDAIQ